MGWTDGDTFYGQSTAFLSLDGTLRHVTRVGVDQQWFLEGFRQFGPDYANTILNPEYSRIEYHMGNMLGMRATEESIDVIKNVLRDEPGRYNRLGRRTHPLRKARQSHWQLFRESLNKDAANAPAAYLPSRMQHLESIIRMCDERGVELHLVFLPQHALSLEQQHRAGQWPAVQSAKRDLTHLVANYKRRHRSADVTVWDFWRYSKYTTKPVPPADDAQMLMQWHWESSHFTKEFGDLVLWRIFEGAGPNGEPLYDLGVRLTPQNIDEELMTLEEARARFAAEHPQVMAIFDEQG